MKRMTVCLVTVLLLFVLLVSASSAETVYQLNYFELSLPDGWKYNKKEDWYELKTATTSQNVTLIEYKDSFSGTPTVPEIVAEMKTTLRLEDDYSDWEEITVDGRQTALFTLHPAGNQEFYVASLRSPMGRTCYAFFRGNGPGAGKAEMLAILDGLHYRKMGEISYFRHGTAEVKYNGYEIQTVGNQNYLLVRFTWRNIGTEADLFAVNVDVTAYQDGIELQDATLIAKNSEVGTKIMPGKEISVGKVFVLRKLTGTITLVVDKLMDYSNEWPDREYEFQLK